MIKKIIYLFGYLTSFINYKYFYNLNELITYFVSKKKNIKIRLLKDTYFIFPLKDPYYNRLIYPKFKYEPEIELILNKIKKINYLFLDVGANLGFWSLIVSSYKYKKKVLALEPLSLNYKFLKLNKNKNTNRFQIIKIAAGEKQKKSRIYFDGEISNAGASIVSQNKKKFNEIIKVQKIDNILKKNKENKVVIKLDVEGNEINALIGAKNTLIKKDCLVIYEDHAKDKNHYNTKFFLKKKYFIYYFNKKKVYKIEKINELNRIKKIPHKGYNFVATKSELFISTLNR